MDKGSLLTDKVLESLTKEKASRLPRGSKSASPFSFIDEKLKCEGVTACSYVAIDLRSNALIRTLTFSEKPEILREADGNIQVVS